MSDFDGFRELGEQEFLDEYEPITNPESGDMTWSLSDTWPQPVDRVWTVVDGDSGAQWALPGYHVVNATGDYVVTEKAWDTDMIAGLWWPADEDDDEDDANDVLNRELGIHETTPGMTQAIEAILAARTAPADPPWEHFLPGAIDDAPDTFDAYELHVVAEYADPHGGTFCEQLDSPDRVNDDADEIAGIMFTLYGHFTSGGVNAITDSIVDEENGWEKARTYIRQLAGSIAGDRPIYDYTFDKPPTSEEFKAARATVTRDTPCAGCGETMPDEFTPSGFDGVLNDNLQPFHHGCEDF